MSETRPLAYGYLHALRDVDDHVIGVWERQLRECAEGHGFEFAAIFYEFPPGARGAWDELTTELPRSAAHHVIVPSLSHVSRHPLLRSSMLDRIAEDAQAEVLEVSDR